MRRSLTLISLATVASFAHGGLPSLNLDTNALTVSGLSSGGYMANQFHIAHSDWVAGAGLIASGAYYCGQNDIKVALSECVNQAPEDSALTALNQQVDGFVAAGLVAPLSHLKNSRVWILHGTEDTRVAGAVTERLVQQYQQWVDADNLVYINDKPFAHHFPTLTKGGDCATSAAPFIGQCDYDAAGEMLSFLLEKASPPSGPATGKLYTIDQQQRGKESAESLADEGFVYVPTQCEKGQACQVHVSFHGCNQNAEAVNDTYATQTGLNRWADSNNLVVLYPQTKKSMFMPLNPQACWDWWGYTDEHYATQKGQQIQAVANIVNSLTTD
ncbi:polyhydroxybutyrate depolymerase [Aestuariibacter halophilus]|uniref:Polyhydroxybutyrate depolymerase n=1 Tax=Fluctibacter halophilus TaxID=226011 RepID=A0ABS8G649_9ALTE|nr:PHB depolymerase family esterase [Aestuariibacter halophilus]MCC2616057.1 polyhydroxybutyrate depolymerase [Aestuariibacter halophilus]